MFCRDVCCINKASRIHRWNNKSGKLIGDDRSSSNAWHTGFSKSTFLHWGTCVELNCDKGNKLYWHNGCTKMHRLSNMKYFLVQFIFLCLCILEACALCCDWSQYRWGTVNVVKVIWCILMVFFLELAHFAKHMCYEMWESSKT